MIYRTAFLAACLTAGFSLIQAHATDRQDFCAKKWPGNYRMQEHCWKQQIEGGERWQAYIRRHNLTDENENARARAGDPAALIFNNCWEKWSHDWAMNAHCVEQEEEAAKRLGKFEAAL